MPKDLLQGANAPTRDQLKEIVSAEGPCITLMLPLEGPQGPAKQHHTRMRHGIAEAERLLKVAGVDEAQIRLLLQAIRDFADDWEPGDGKPGGIALLRNSETFRVFRLASPVEESVTVGNHVEIRPFLR